MAADFPETNTLQCALGVNELEDFEVTEVDGTILWDLLEELENQEKKSDKSELNGYAPNSMMTMMTIGEEVSLEKSDISILDSNSNWVRMEDMIAETDPLREIEGWFTDDMVGMVDFGYAVGDYLQLHNGVGASCNEITYNCLWEES